MELNNIKSSNLNWGDAANDLNQNFGKINNAIEQVKNVTTRNKGYFTTSEALIDAYPNGANVGDYGYVGTSYPFNIWKWDGSNWYDTNVKGGENVNLGNFYTKSDSDEIFAKKTIVESLSEDAEKLDKRLNLLTSEVGTVSAEYEMNGSEHSSMQNQVIVSYVKGDVLILGLKSNDAALKGVISEVYLYNNGIYIQKHTLHEGDDIPIILNSDVDAIGVYFPNNYYGTLKLSVSKINEDIQSQQVSFENDGGYYFDVNTNNGVVTILRDISYADNIGATVSNKIASGKTFGLKPSKFRSQVDRESGLVKFVFDIDKKEISVLNYLDLLLPNEIILGMCSTNYGSTYTSFNWVKFNEGLAYTIDGIDKNKIDDFTSKKRCYFYPFDKCTVYDGAVGVSEYNLYDARFHEIYNNEINIHCYTQDKWWLRITFYNQDKAYISSTGTYSRLTEVTPPSNAKYFIVSLQEVDGNGQPVATDIDHYTLGDVVFTNVNTLPLSNDNAFVYTSDAVLDIDTKAGTLTTISDIDIMVGLERYELNSGISIPIKQTSVNGYILYNEAVEMKMSSLTNIVFNRLTKEVYPLCYREPLHQHETILGVVRSSYANGYVSDSFKNADFQFQFTVNGETLNINPDKRFEIQFENNPKLNYFNVDTSKGEVVILNDIYYSNNIGKIVNSYIPSGTTFSLKPSAVRSQIDRESGLVKFVFDTKAKVFTTLQYLDIIKSTELIIGMASSNYGLAYTSFNWACFINGWLYTVDGVSPNGSNKDNSIFSRNSNELEIMETFGASSWYEEFRYIRDEISYIPKLSLIHVSDTHASRNHFGNRYDIITNELVSFANKISTNQGDNYNRGNRVKCVLHSGDIKYSVGSDDFSYYQEAVAKSNIPFYHVLGNHDIGCEGRRKVSEAISDEQAYTQMIEPFLDVWNLKSVNPELCEAHPKGKCYYFNDFENEKIRLISLYGFETRFETDPTDSSLLKYRRDTESWSQGQIDWFVNSLVNLPEGWGVMIHQHYPFGTSTGESNFLSYEKCSRSGSLTIVNDIVQAFMDGSHIVKQYTQEDIITPSISVDCDFSRKNDKTEFIAYLSGHTHRDCIGWIEDYPKQLQLNIGCNNTFYDEGSDVTHEMGKKGQDMFNVYCIDRNNGLVNILRVGANLSCYGQQRHMETIMYRK